MRLFRDTVTTYFLYTSYTILEEEHEVSRRSDAKTEGNLYTIVEKLKRTVDVPS